MTTTTEALLREVRTILADYVERIDRVGPEAFRLWREDHRDWDRKQARIRACLAQLEAVTEAKP